MVWLQSRADISYIRRVVGTPRHPGRIRQPFGEHRLITYGNNNILVPDCTQFVRCSRPSLSARTNHDPRSGTCLHVNNQLESSHYVCVVHLTQNRILLILTPLSYLPINRNIAAMLVIPPTNGISISTALLLALCAQSQMVNMYYLWMSHPFKKWGMVVPKPPRRIDYINLAQITTQWICAVGLYVHLFIPYQPQIFTLAPSRR